MKRPPHITSQSIVIDDNKPCKVNVEAELEQTDVLGESEVRLEIRASPINPLDVAVINGIYPVRPQHYSGGKPIPGYDGIAEVIDVGHAGGSSLAPGDFVIPGRHGLGMWRTIATVDQSWVEKISMPTDMRFGAMIKGSVMPAYFLIEDMVTLKPGDWVVQNAGTSTISQFVVQFARLKGAGTINIVRDRSAKDMEAIHDQLSALGADIVMTESDFANGSSKVKGCNIVLAIDSVFGDSGGRLLRSLAHGGTYVQLGFLAGPQTKLSVGAQDLFAKQVTMRAFRGAVQLAQRTPAERRKLLDDLVDTFNQGLLALPTLGTELIKWNCDDAEGNLADIAQAVGKAKAGNLGQRKQIIIFP